MMNDPKNPKSLNPKSSQELPPMDSVETPRSINFLLDIPLELTVEVGRRAMTMGELIELMPGTVVELDRPAGGQLDIMANGKIIAKGEAVVVGDRYGVRVLEIVGDDPFNPSVPNAQGGNE
jgi:flagellar motor switch protein FliN/FliY